VAHWWLRSEIAALVATLAARTTTRCSTSTTRGRSPVRIADAFARTSRREQRRLPRRAPARKGTCSRSAGRELWYGALLHVRPGASAGEPDRACCRDRRRCSHRLDARRLAERIVGEALVDPVLAAAARTLLAALSPRATRGSNPRRAASKEGRVRPSALRWVERTGLVQLLLPPAAAEPRPEKVSGSLQPSSSPYQWREATRRRIEDADDRCAIGS
jgi:hypothetical protein